jgi:hypothetical protein
VWPPWIIPLVMRPRIKLPELSKRAPATVADCTVVLSMLKKRTPCVGVASAQENNQQAMET